MKSGAEPRTSLYVRGAGLSDRVDYRLMETPEEKDCIYLMRYKAYLHGGVTAPSDSQRVSDHYDDAPNAWVFGVYVDGELCSSLRLNVADVGMPDLRYSRLVRRCSSPPPRSRRSFHRSASFCCRPRKSEAVPRASLSDAAAGLYGMRAFQRRYRARAGPCRASGVLSPGVPARGHRRSAFVSGLFAEGGIAGVRFPESARTGPGPFSHYALDCLRAADAVPASLLPGLHDPDPGYCLRAHLDRSAFLNRS